MSSNESENSANSTDSPTTSNAPDSNNSLGRSVYEVVTSRSLVYEGEPLAEPGETV